MSSQQQAQFLYSLRPLSLPENLHIYVLAMDHIFSNMPKAARHTKGGKIEPHANGNTRNRSLHDRVRRKIRDHCAFGHTEPRCLTYYKNNSFTHR